tara:strand:- start:443 stop:634 length:192 start_codon:yes stop_codon:yes gene_type:complete
MKFENYTKKEMNRQQDQMMKMQRGSKIKYKKGNVSTISDFVGNQMILENGDSLCFWTERFTVI